MAKVLSVQIGRPRTFEHGGHLVRSAIWKSGVAGRVADRGVNLEGDEQADRKAHGGYDKALYAYAVEDLRWWGEQLSRSLAHGEFGENLLALTIRDVFRIYTDDRDEVHRLAENPNLSESWRAWAQHLLAQRANTNER